MFNFAHPAGGAGAFLLSPLPAVVNQWTPSNLIAGWAVTDGVVSFPLASLPRLDAAKADGLTGDARQVIASLISLSFDWYNRVSIKPTAVIFRYQPGPVSSFGPMSGAVRTDFVTSIYTDYLTGTVTEE
jgi:hypothetical protein